MCSRGGFGSNGGRGVLQHPYSYREEITRMCRPGNVAGLRGTAVAFSQVGTGWPTCYSNDEHDSGMRRSITGLIRSSGRQKLLRAVAPRIQIMFDLNNCNTDEAVNNDVDAVAEMQTTMEMLKISRNSECMKFTWNSYPVVENIHYVVHPKNPDYINIDSAGVYPNPYCVYSGILTFVFEPVGPNDDVEKILNSRFGLIEKTDVKLDKMKFDIFTEEGLLTVSRPDRTIQAIYGAIMFCKQLSEDELNKAIVQTISTMTKLSKKLKVDMPRSIFINEIVFDSQQPHALLMSPSSLFNDGYAHRDDVDICLNAFPPDKVETSEVCSHGEEGTSNE